MEKLKHLSDKAQKDYELVQRALNNDQRAYGEMMDRYRDAVYYTLFKMVRNEGDAEDLTIEAFGKAFRRLESYTPDFAFSTWLFRIATNNAIDFLRKKRAQTVSIDQGMKDDDGDNVYFEIKSTSLNPEEEAIKLQKGKILREVVEKLKPRYKRLIELRYFEEYAYEEIAEELDLPLGTVKAQLFRARHLLNEILKENRGNI